MRGSIMENLSLFDVPGPVGEGGEFWTAPVVSPAPTPPAPRESLITLPPRPVRQLEDRWYQTKALAEIARRLPWGAKRVGNKGQLLVSPTGCGKTSIASRHIRQGNELGYRILVLVDMDRLLTQMQEDLWDEGIRPHIEKAEERALADFMCHGGTVLGSMQSLYPARLARWPRNAFDLIVIDEAHEFKYLHILEYFRDTPYLGLTATPVRSDGQSLKRWYDYPYIRTLTLREAIEGWIGEYDENGHKIYGAPFLSRIKIGSIPAPQIDYSKIKTVGKDLSRDDQDRLIWEHTNFIASALIENAGDRPTWVYCPKVATANAIAEALRSLGAAAAAYHSKVPDPVAIMQRFEAGDLQFLTNVDMLIKGVNVRKVACIARVKASLLVGRTTQEIGRGTRLSPETGKEDCLILEFKPETGGKQLASVIDAILDGADDPDAKPTKAVKEFRRRVRDRMNKLVENASGTVDALDIERQAEEEIKAEDEAARAAKEAKKKKKEAAEYQRVEVGEMEVLDPLAGLKRKAEATPGRLGHTPASMEQLQKIEELSDGYIKATSKPKRWTAEMAAEKIDELQHIKDFKLATLRQRDTLVRRLHYYEHDIASLTRAQATDLISYRREEMIFDLEAVGHHREELKAMPLWRLAVVYDKAFPLAEEGTA